MQEWLMRITKNRRDERVLECSREPKDVLYDEDDAYRDSSGGLYTYLF